MLIETPSRYQLMIYLAVTFALTAIMHYILIAKMHTVHTVLTFALMWIPGAVGIACSHTFGHEGRDIGWRKPELKYLVLAYAVPAVAAVLILATLLAMGIGSFSMGDSRHIVNRLVFAPTMGVLLSTLAALGEEVGWRGFMQSRLIAMQYPNPFLFTGLVWAAWHIPLILFSDYATSPMPWISAALFTIMITSFSIFLGQLREASRSIWPVALAHGVHNTWIQGIYPGFIKAGALDAYFGGEAGVILAVLYLLWAAALLKTRIK